MLDNVKPDNASWVSVYQFYLLTSPFWIIFFAIFFVLRRNIKKIYIYKSFLSYFE